jgi:hypothetical protein
MKRLALVMLIGATAALSTGCSLGHPPANPAVGDACLVGSWTLDHEENRSGYSYAGTPVSVTGLHGARLTLAADGTETEAFAGSDPLVGRIADGRELSIRIEGSYSFQLRADGHQYVETGTDTPLPTTATIGGVSIPDYRSSYSPGRGTYECSQRSLAMTTASGVQTDRWSRA